MSTLLGYVYVKSGDLNAKIRRDKYPQTEEELISVVREAIESHPHDEMELGQLMLISRSSNAFFEDDWWISSKSALEKAGYKVEKKDGE